MIRFNRVSYHLSFMLFVGIASWYALGTEASWAQTAPQSPQPKKTSTKATPPKATVKRPPLTKAAIQKLWDEGDQDLLLNELKLRGLAFEPEEDWVAQLKDPASMPLAIAELRKRIPPGPTPETVAAEVSTMLPKLKEAAQNRSESALEPLVHPDLLANKASIYDLFDIANYRSHTVGRVTQMENRRVGVQFFQLTTSQVERLHYLVFSNYHDKVVLREVLTGPKVADQFLKDEREIAKSKLDLMFRSLNDKDDSGLKNLCTPGLYDSLKHLTEGSGSTLVRGAYTSINSIALTPTVSLDQKSVRVIVRVGFPDPGGKPLEYDVDFERVDKDLKVVRVRDMQGKVIAWDPNIDNYLNRRYGLPDGEPVKTVAETDDPRFQPLSRIRLALVRALETREAAKLKEYAAELVARLPKQGDGYGVLAAADEISGNYDEAAKDATLAIERGGTAYFVLSRHISGMTSVTTLQTGNQFAPVILGVSKAKIEYHAFSEQGGAAEEIPIASIKQNQLEKTYMGGKPRPFMGLEFNNGKKAYNFASFGTNCQATPTTPPTPSNTGLEVYQGGSVCPAPQQQSSQKSGRFGIPIPSIDLGKIMKAQNSPILVPHNWQQDLKVVSNAIDLARHGSSGQVAQ